MTSAVRVCLFIALLVRATPGEVIKCNASDELQPGVVSMNPNDYFILDAGSDLRDVEKIELIPGAPLIKAFQYYDQIPIREAFVVAQLIEPRWTDWLDSDDPSGEDGGDFERISDFNQTEVCGKYAPDKIECRIKGLRETVFSGPDSTTDENVTCLASEGLSCRNSDQSDNKTCEDYEVRFHCPGYLEPESFSGIIFKNLGSLPTIRCTGKQAKQVAKRTLKREVLIPKFPPASGYRICFRRVKPTRSIVCKGTEVLIIYKFKIEYFVVKDKVRTDGSRYTVVVNAITKSVIGYWEDIDKLKGTGIGGNPKTGVRVYGKQPLDFLDITVKGKSCILKNPLVWTIHNQFQRTPLRAPFSYDCATANVGQDFTNGAYSPLNDAHFYATKTLEMFEKWYNGLKIWKTYPMKVLVHYSSNLQNAFWDGSYIKIGDGASLFYPLTGKNVIGHELGHAATEFISQLEYRGESGGMNEAFSDVVGEALESYLGNGVIDWKVGADVVKTQLPAGGLRSMQNPPLDQRSIDNYQQYTAGLDVHYSSGVFNKAFYLLATKPNWNVKKAFDVYLCAQWLWTESSTMPAGGCGLIRSSCYFRYEYRDVIDALSQVGLICHENIAFPCNY